MNSPILAQKIWDCSRTVRIGGGGEFVQPPVAQMVAAYDLVLKQALKDEATRIWYASYELTRALSATLQSALPSIESIEAELSAPAKDPK